MGVEVCDRAFDPGSILSAFTQRVDCAGAIVTFTGITRDVAEGDLQAMEIEHYPGMTERALADIRTQAMDRFNLIDALIIHRHGCLSPGETIMMVATAAPHRRDAFEAADFLMDYLKSRAPFWKREITARGADWVVAKDEDEEALNRW
ncbi:molybdenum cofactor biosynthesis protein MoaE [Gymnodinialimonas hymeniacidonis]|uniref:molybdenum cofactor biosynthesis protein MoaE n=1 Tax=Gymnodinialimonas hymeniacidonis TaxID=3126508 RepID=UPI0034C6AB5E